MKIGLALSGGGARGIAHIGVLSAMEKIGVRPSVISGTSAGSIVGALYAAGKSPDEILALARKGSLFKNLNIRIPRGGFMVMVYLKRMLQEQLEDRTFEDLDYPFYIATTNLNTGKVEFFNKGPLVDVIVASSNIPVLFRPVEMGGQLYVDGGLTSNLPSEIIRDKCDKLIGVNLVPRFSATDEQLVSIIQIANRCFDLSVLNNIKPALTFCDIIIEPESLFEISRFSFRKYEKIFQMGFESTFSHQLELKQMRRLSK